MDFPIIIIWVSPLLFLGASGAILKLYSFLRWKFSKQTEWDAAFWGYSVRLCPIKGTPGLSDSLVFVTGCVLQQFVPILLQFCPVVDFTLVMSFNGMWQTICFLSTVFNWKKKTWSNLVIWGCGMVGLGQDYVPNLSFLFFFLFLFIFIEIL